jgi:hypothetical protein
MKSTEYISPTVEIVEPKLAENFALDPNEPYRPDPASLGPLTEPCDDPYDPDCTDYNL